MHRWWVYKMVQLSWEIVWQFHAKLKINLPYDLASPLLGIYSEEMKISIHKKLECS